MRHRKKKGILSRKKAPREALLRNLAGQLIMHEKIKTTESKAKILKSVVEKLISTARENTVVNRRKIKKILYSEKQINKLFSEITPRLKKRKSGYLRISKLGNRKGDNAAIVQIEILNGDEKKQTPKSK